jgi:hypothetical protein
MAAWNGDPNYYVVNGTLNVLGTSTVTNTYNNGTSFMNGQVWPVQQWQPTQQQAINEAMYRYAQSPQQQSQQKEQVSMRGLFEVFVVDPESGKIVTEEVVVADSDKKAELKVMRAIDADPDDVDIIVRRLGDVRPKRKVQEVRMVKE